MGQSCVKYRMSSSTTWSRPTVREIRSGLHCGGDIVIDELMPDVSVKDRFQVHFLPFLRLLYFLCFLHQALPARIRFCRIIAAFLPRSTGAVCLKFAWVIVSTAAHLGFGNMVTAVRRSLSTLIRPRRLRRGPVHGTWRRVGFCDRTRPTTRPAPL